MAKKLSARDKAFTDLTRRSYEAVKLNDGDLGRELSFDVHMRRENLYAWRRDIGGSAPPGMWSGKSRMVIDKILVDHMPVEGKPSLWDDGKKLMKVLGKAYPFGAREGWPYKTWLAELRIVRRLVAPPCDIALADYEILQVARDAELGATKENKGLERAEDLMKKITHDVYAGACVICGAVVKERCINMEAISLRPISEQQPGLFDHLPSTDNQRHAGYYQIVPHEGRIRTRLAQPL